MLRRSLVATTELAFGTDRAMARLIQIDLFSTYQQEKPAEVYPINTLDRLNSQTLKGGKTHVRLRILPLSPRVVVPTCDVHPVSSRDEGSKRLNDVRIRPPGNRQAHHFWEKEKEKRRCRFILM
jgi:hypothetical protein